MDAQALLLDERVIADRVQLQVRRKRDGPQRTMQRQRNVIFLNFGLRRIGHTVEVADNPQIRGMLHKVRHLVEVQES